MPASSLEQMSLEDLMALRTQLQGQRTDLQRRIVAKSRELGVDPALALSTAHIESMFNPDATSRTGVKGLFQVTLPTGQQYGQTAQNRTDPEVSIHAGVSELKRLLEASGGDVRKALKGYGDPKQANYADLVLAQYPRYAQTVGQEPSPPGTGPSDLRQMPMEELLRLRDTLRGAAPSAAPRPAPPAAPAPSLGEAPPPLQPPIDIAKPAPDAPPPAAAGPMLPRILPGSLDEWLRGKMGFAQPGQPPPQPLDLPTLARGAAAMGVEGLTTAAGTTAGALGGPLAPVTVPLGAGLGALYGHRLNQQFGLTPTELGQTSSLMPQNFPDYLTLGLGAAPAALHQALPYTRAGRAVRRAAADTAAGEDAARAALRQQQAARAQAIAESERKAAAEISTVEAKARTGTEAGHAKWLQDMETYNRDLAGRLLQRKSLVETAEREALEATVHAQDTYRTEGIAAYRAATDEARSLRDAATQARTDYETAVREHSAAVRQAETLAARYAPQRPAKAPANEPVSKYYYDVFTKQHGAVPVNLAPSSPLLKEVGEEAVRYNAPPRFHQALADLAELGDTAPAGKLYQIMKDVGTVTRHRDYRLSTPAKRLYRELSEAMERSAPPEAVDALQTAKRTWMHEEGVAALQDVLGRRKGATILHEDAQGRLTLNVPRLREVVTDPKYLELQKWLPEAEYKALEAETRGMLGTPAMPQGALPPGPNVAPLPGLLGSQPPPPPPTVPEYPPPVTIKTPPQMPAPQEVGAVRPVPWSPPAELQPTVPVEPTLRPPAITRLSAETLIPFLVTLAYGRSAGTAATVGLGIAGGDLLMHGLAKVMLSPAGRPLLQQAIANGGRISPELATMIGAFAAEVTPRSSGREGRNR